MSKPNSKPSKAEVVKALEILAKWATGSDRTGNPYCQPEIKHTLRVLARERGMNPENYLDVEL